MFSWRKFFGLSEPTAHGTSVTLHGSGFGDSEPDDEPEFERYRIPRQVVLLRPKQPYLRWVEQSNKRSNDALRQYPEYAKLLDASTAKKRTLAEMCADCTAYLIELHDEEGLTATEHVERDFVFFFKRELEQWEGTDETHWPANMTLPLFRQWFDIECFDMVLDTTKV